MTANPNRCRFVKNDFRQRIRSCALREDLQQMSGTSFFHLDRNGQHIERSRGKQFFRHVAEVLRRHVVDVCFKHDDASGGTVRRHGCLFADHQAEAIGKVGKLFGTRSIANPVGGKGRHRTKPVDHCRKNGSARRSHKFGLSMLLVNGSMP